ncbi:MAG: HEPN domain-containing protein [Pseudomonadota bacterium]
MDDWDQINRRINDFAIRSFRDVADRDYIAARMACRAQLLPQFMWSAQQAIEKYLKCILLVNRIPAKKVGHNISAALDLTKKLTFALEIHPQSQAIISHLAAYGQYRYLDVSYFVDGHVLPQLDMAVWELRRYCQVLNVFGKILPDAEQQLLEQCLVELKESKNKSPHIFRLRDGLLESIVDDKGNPARGPLIWQNALFGKKARRTIKSQYQMHAANAPLYLFPQMLEELVKYVKIPDKLQDAYRSLLKPN